MLIWLIRNCSSMKIQHTQAIFSLTTFLPSWWSDSPTLVAGAAAGKCQRQVTVLYSWSVQLWNVWWSFHGVKIFYGQPEEGGAHQVEPSHQEQQQMGNIELQLADLAPASSSYWNIVSQYFTFYMGPGQAGVAMSMVRRALEADNHFLAFPKYNSLRPKLHYRLAMCEEQHWFVL